MSNGSLVRVFDPADVQQLTEAKLALEGAGIPCFVHNEQYLNAMGLPFSLGVAQVTVLVADVDAEDAAAALDDWFGVPGEEPRLAEEPDDARRFASPLLVILGLLGFTELAIALGRRLTRRRTDDDVA
ncbi:MAG TPA: DUF2007 domain-containing protein [Longimicrobiales bacterium]